MAYEGSPAQAPNHELILSTSRKMIGSLKNSIGPCTTLQAEALNHQTLEVGLSIDRRE